ncbi:thioredoxin family protein [Clostridiaceae bacterium M8S5]|nr:thioredoxin family protein [Clostridiaceae bacterium M8S5]
MVDDLNIKDINNIVFKSDKIVIICFYSSIFKPSLTTIEYISEAVKKDNQFDIYKVDYYKHKEIVKNFEVITIPTIIFFKEGKEKYRTSGSFKEKQIKDIIGFVKVC